MSTTTANLELFKYNTTADASTPFSINTALNDNWDKIDAFAGGIDTLFNGDLSDATGKNLFSDINTELGKKLEADVLLEENGYIKFNNNLIFQWYYITDESSNPGYKTLTLTTALNYLYFATYSCGQNDYTTHVFTYSLMSIIDNFNKTEVNICFRGGDQRLYMTHGFVLIIGS